MPSSVKPVKSDDWFFSLPLEEFPVVSDMCREVCRCFNTDEVALTITLLQQSEDEGELTVRLTGKKAEEAYHRLDSFYYGWYAGSGDYEWDDEDE